MADLIDREALLSKIEPDEYYHSNEIRDILQDCPTITPESLVRHGMWIKKHKQTGGFRRYTGIDDMGEQHTITVDERVEFDDLYCSECGKQSADNFLNYCPNCGAIMDLV